MAGYVDKLQKAASDELRPGDIMLAGIRAQPRGTAAASGVGGLLGAGIAHLQTKKARAGTGEGSMASNWPAAAFALGFTDQRLLAFKRSALLGRPKDLQAEVPLDQVADVRTEKGALMRKVHVAFVDGSSIALECGKIEKVEDFISAFTTAKAAAR